MSVFKEGVEGAIGAYVGISAFGFKFNNISRGLFGASGL